MSALPIAEPRDVRRAAVRLIRTDLHAFTLMILLNALASAAGLAGPWLLGRIIDAVKGGEGVETVDRLALLIVVFVVAQLLLARFAVYTGYRFGERMLARIREQLVSRVLELPSAAVERAGTGDLTARGTSDVTSVGVTLRDLGPQVLVATVQALFIFGAIVVLSPLLGLCTVLGMSSAWFAARWYMRRAPAAYLAEGTANAALAEQLTATAAGARTVEAFGLEQRRIAATESAIDGFRTTRLRTLRLRSVLFPAVDVAFGVPVVAVLLVGSVLQIQGLLSLGTVVAAALYARQLAQPLDVVLTYLDQLQSSTSSFTRVEGLASAPEGATATAALVASASKGALVLPLDDRIEVVDVCHGYDGGADVLHHVDLTVQPGERLVVVGPSGAGKSTLSRLLAGVDAPRSGLVAVGGVPVVDLDSEQLRRRIVLVTQEHHVFIGTIRENLRIGAPAATDEELHVALAAVSADWAIKLPDGLNTEVGSGGLRLDGSQVQQLALARVVLADPHTLILDEATALLDPLTARHTERALAAVLKGRTVIAIAHRLHSAHDADRVAVMEQGQITELGTHDELMAAEGAYSRLWTSWHG